LRSETGSENGTEDETNAEGVGVCILEKNGGVQRNSWDVIRIKRRAHGGGDGYRGGKTGPLEWEGDELGKKRGLVHWRRVKKQQEGLYKHQKNSYGGVRGGL